VIPLARISAWILLPSDHGRFIGHSSSDVPEAKESLLRRNEEESRSRVSLFARSRCLSQEINVRPTKLADRRESNGDTVLRIILTSRVREKKREMAMLVPFLREMRELLSSYRIAQSSEFRVQSVEPDILYLSVPVHLLNSHRKCRKNSRHSRRERVGRKDVKDSNVTARN